MEREWRRVGCRTRGKEKWVSLTKKGLRRKKVRVKRWDLAEATEKEMALVVYINEPNNG